MWKIFTSSHLQSTFAPTGRWWLFLSHVSLHRARSVVKSINSFGNFSSKNVEHVMVPASWMCGFMDENTGWLLDVMLFFFVFFFFFFFFFKMSAECVVQAGGGWMTDTSIVMCVGFPVVLPPLLLSSSPTGGQLTFSSNLNSSLRALMNQFEVSVCWCSPLPVPPTAVEVDL